jgi:hypothetical protein
VKATCPVCLRQVSVSERRELRPHNRRKTRRGHEPDPCPGSGRQPLDQAMLNVEPGRYDPATGEIPY